MTRCGGMEEGDMTKCGGVRRRGGGLGIKKEAGEGNTRGD
jgi:hypothetical protein